MLHLPITEYSALSLHTTDLRLGIWTDLADDAQAARLGLINVGLCNTDELLNLQGQHHLP